MRWNPIYCDSPSHPFSKTQNQNQNHHLYNWLVTAMTKKKCLKPKPCKILKPGELAKRRDSMIAAMYASSRNQNNVSFSEISSTTSSSQNQVPQHIEETMVPSFHLPVNFTNRPSCFNRKKILSVTPAILGWWCM